MGERMDGARAAVAGDCARIAVDGGSARTHRAPRCARARRRAPAFALRVAALAILAATAVGCGPGRAIRFEGHPAADCFVEVPPQSGTLTLVGRTAQDPDGALTTYALLYELPAALMNAVVEVRVRTESGTFRYRVYTDRDVTVRYPPEGGSMSAAQDGVEPLASGRASPPRPSGTGAGAARAPAPPERPATAVAGPGDDLPDDVPSATITEE